MVTRRVCVQYPVELWQEVGPSSNNSMATSGHHYPLPSLSFRYGLPSLVSIWPD